MGKIYIVGTPIGNLNDFTIRAIETLNSVDVIACEDTRHSLKLLNHYQIKKRLISFHSYNQLNNVDKLIKMVIDEDINLALITDSGTPCISDPGSVLVNKAIERNIEVIPIPGASAITTLYSVSGFSGASFYFAGFLSPKSQRQKNQLNELSKIKTNIIFYESSHRINKFLNNLSESFMGKPVVIGRELTKIHETLYRGIIGELLISEKDIINKGEFVIIIDNRDSKSDE